jgi:acetyl esterase/lipase
VFKMLRKPMSTKHLLDPSLLPLLDFAPPFQFSLENLQRFRDRGLAAAVLGDAKAQGVKREAITIPGPDCDIPCLLYSPLDASTSSAYLHIHGGGYVAGSIEGSDAMNTRIAAQLGVVVLTVGYRLAPEHPVPAPLDDCYAALGWLHQQADALGIDRQRIAIGGESAGGGLAAALAIHARDLGEFAICHQHLTYPMLDDQTGTDAAPGDPLVGEFVWNRHCNGFGWSCYLGDMPAQAPFVPARVESVKGLPPTWMFTVGLDLFRDENIDYAQRLMAAGIATELVVLPGACHAFQWVPDSPLTQRYIHSHLEALGKALN